jgi:hypothetical protein
MDHQAIQSIVVAFPTLAAYLIVLMFAGGIGTMLWGGRKILGRLDEQDKTMGSIRDLLASEIAKLREMNHEIELRVIVIEERCRISHNVEDGTFVHRRRDDPSPITRHK